MHVEGHIESGSGYSSGGGTSSGPRRTNRTPIGSAGTDMGSGMMGNPTMGGGMMMGIVQSDGSTMTPMGISSPFVSKLVNQSLSRLSEPAKPSAIFSMNGEPIINEQKNTNSFYLLFPESSPEIIQRTKNQQFVSNMSNGYNIPIQSQIQSTYEYNIPIQSQIQSTYVQDQISLQEFAIPINKFSDINSQITSQRISQRVVYATNIPVNKFADMGSVSNTTGVVIQSKPISLTKLV
jgi:hypothetical protein